MLQKVDIVVTDSVPRFVVEDAVCSDTSSTGRFDWNTSIKSCMGRLFHIRPITEPLIFKKIVDDMNLAGILVVAIRPFVSFWDIDGVFTD